MSIELSQVVLNHGLTFLAVSTGVVVIIIAVYLVKLLKKTYQYSQKMLMRHLY